MVVIGSIDDVIDKTEEDLYQMTEEKICKDYDNNKVYTLTSVGITVEEFERCDRNTMMFIHILAPIVKACKATDVEIKTIEGYLKDLEKAYIDRQSLRLTPAECDRLETAVKSMGLTKDKHGNYYKVKRITPILNNYFFKCDYKGNYSYNNNNTATTVDPDKQYWMYKTWVFTNVDPKDSTIHVVDRSNRPGLVRVKNDLDEITYTALNIPTGAKGVFIVKDSVLARPEFDSVRLGIKAETASPYRHYDSISSDLTAMISKFDVTKCYTQELRDEYKPWIIPNDKDLEESMFHRYGKYGSVVTDYMFAEEKKEPSKTYTNPLLPYSPLKDNRNWYLSTNYRVGLPLELESASLFNGGIDTYYLDNMMKDEDASIALKRWKSIVKAHYDNHNIEYDIKGNDKDTIRYKNVYDNFIRTQVGKVSDYVIRHPESKEELRASYIKSDDVDQAAYLCSAGANKFIQAVEPGTWETSNYRLEETAYTYGNVLFLESVVNNAGIRMYPVNTGHDWNDFRRSVNKRLSETRNSIFNALASRNGISTEDIIFIPIEKIMYNGGTYYDNNTDLMVAINEIAGDRLEHPYSKSATGRQSTKENRVLDNIGIGGMCKIRSSSPNMLGKTYYTKIMGRVCSIAVENSYGVEEKIIVTTNNPGDMTLVEYKYDITEENLNALEIYTDRNMAVANGMTEEFLTSKKLDADIRNIETKNLTTDFKIKEVVFKQKELVYKNKKLDIDYATYISDQMFKLKDKELDVAIKKADVEEKIRKAKIKESPGDIATKLLNNVFQGLVLGQKIWYEVKNIFDAFTANED